MHGNHDDDDDLEEEDKKMLQRHSEQRLAVLQGDDSVPEDDIEEASWPTRQMSRTNLYSTALLKLLPPLNLGLSFMWGPYMTMYNLSFLL